MCVCVCVCGGECVCVCACAMLQCTWVYYLFICGNVFDQKNTFFKLFGPKVYSGEQSSFSHAVALRHSCFLSLYHCNTLQHTSIHTATHSNTVTLTHSCVFSLCRCNILQHIFVISSAATHCNTLLQYTLCDSLSLVCPLSLSLQRTAIHTATHKLADSCCHSLCHCNTLQHAAATHYQCVACYHCVEKWCE